MFTCQYCNTTYIKFQTICAGCGANLTPEGAIKLPISQSAIERIRQICGGYEDAREFLPQEALSEKNLRNAKKKFTAFPDAENSIILFCDTHPLRKGKRGFIISEDGLYWENTWAAETNRNYLTWDEFTKRELKLKHYHIHLGRGDVIGLSGLGNDEKRDKAERLLNEIKTALKINS